MDIALPKADELQAIKPATLENNVTGIRLVTDEHKRLRFGGISELPKGAEFHRCGDGYNDRTVMVHCQGTFYFVFLRDLDRMSMSGYIED